MLLVGSENAVNALPAAMAVLKAGGSALDAVETAIRLVEIDPEEHSVGLGSWPNLLGELELDASLMDGRTRASGAVGALQGYPYAISVARKVLEELPHVFLVGQGAADFAAEMGFARQETLTPVAKEEWMARLLVNVPAADLPDLLHRRKMAPWVSLAKDPQRIHGTVDVIAIDGAGNIASGVSTSGWAWKYPGRLGDSPVIGAGNYCDNRFGAAACTGHGELAIRAGTARTVLLFMQMGMSLADACAAAIRDLPVDPHFEEIGSFMNIVAVDRHGNHCGVSNSTIFGDYCYMTPEMAQGVLTKRTIVSLV
ncbi:MAG: asparaginase [Caldilinea sp. CFX5]|nr:asparaginase [Caldilinea sp. CFX5]